MLQHIHHFNFTLHEFIALAIYMGMAAVLIIVGTQAAIRLYRGDYDKPQKPGRKL